MEGAPEGSPQGLAGRSVIVRAMRVLLLATPLDARAHLDGTRLAVVELATALASQGLARPLVLVPPGVEAPPGCEGIVVRGRSPAAVIAASVRARPSIVHALFAPRRRTGLALAAMRAMLRVPIVQTIASVPRGTTWPSLVGDVVVATSSWMEGELARAKLPARRRARVPMPFSPPLDVRPEPSAPRTLFLHVGDWEHGGGIDETLDAFAQLAPPMGVVPHLAFAARRKSAASARREVEIRARIEAKEALRGRVHVLGERDSLLPWIASARCVLLPASSTHAKLDHPRALLEAIALGTRIVVGPAPSLAELVVAPALGEVAIGTAALREAMERTFSAEPPEARDVLAVLEPRRPELVAAIYADLYSRSRSGG
jgi:glycosyltransferase involved in cell wall biosynthesis